MIDIDSIGRISTDYAFGPMYDHSFMPGNPDVAGGITVDAWPADAPDDGEVLAEVFCTVHGDVVVAYRHPQYRQSSNIRSYVDEACRRLHDDFDDFATRTQKKILEVYDTIREAKI